MFIFSVKFALFSNVFFCFIPVALSLVLFTQIKDRLKKVLKRCYYLLFLLTFFLYLFTFFINFSFVCFILFLIHILIFFILSLFLWLSFIQNKQLLKPVKFLTNAKKNWNTSNSTQICVLSIFYHINKGFEGWN